MLNIVRTSFNIDNDLLDEAITLSGSVSKTDVVSNALQEFVMARRKKNLADLKGQIKFMDDYDYKAMRREEILS
jgi:metal-responsive CopG/Arc/MetJ family transcriptional regulator